MVRQKTTHGFSECLEALRCVWPHKIATSNKIQQYLGVLWLYKGKKALTLTRNTQTIAFATTTKSCIS